MHRPETAGPLGEVTHPTLRNDSAANSLPRPRHVAPTNWHPVQHHFGPPFDAEIHRPTVALGHQRRDACCHPSTDRRRPQVRRADGVGFGARLALRETHMGMPGGRQTRPVRRPAVLTSHRGAAGEAVVPRANDPHRAHSRTRRRPRRSRSPPIRPQSRRLTHRENQTLGSAVAPTGVRDQQCGPVRPHLTDVDVVSALQRWRLNAWRLVERLPLFARSSDVEGRAREIDRQIPGRPAAVCAAPVPVRSHLPGRGDVAHRRERTVQTRTHALPDRRRNAAERLVRHAFHRPARDLSPWTDQKFRGVQAAVADAGAVMVGRGREDRRGTNHSSGNVQYVDRMHGDTGTLGGVDPERHLACPGIGDR